jgi:hypothetical protein
MLRVPRFLRQFSLRTLLVVTAIAGLGFGWLGSHWREYQSEQAAMARLRDEAGSGGFLVIYESPIFT